MSSYPPKTDIGLSVTFGVRSRQGLCRFVAQTRPSFSYTCRSAYEWIADIRRRRSPFGRKTDGVPEGAEGRFMTQSCRSSVPGRTGAKRTKLPLVQCRLPGGRDKNRGLGAVTKLGRRKDSLRFWTCMARRHSSGKVASDVLEPERPRLLDRSIRLLVDEQVCSHADLLSAFRPHASDGYCHVWTAPFAQGLI
jgi:hypothetical protein